MWTWIVLRLTVEMLAALNDIHLIVPDPPGGVLVRTSEKASGTLMATGLISATST